MLKKTSNKIIAFIAVAVIAFGGYYIAFGKTSVNEGVQEEKIKATIYKSPTCSCCLSHASYLSGEGFDIETKVEKNTDLIKQKHNIPYNMQSCHTTEIGEYFVEGHVPIEAINKLLTEKPDIDGIALPDMPAGSPGMPGVKREEFIIYSLKDGESQEFMRL
jgi:hypothetical protein